MTLSGLGLVEPEKVEHPEPEEILESVITKEERIFDLIREMQELLSRENGNKTVSKGRIAIRPLHTPTSKEQQCLTKKNTTDVLSG